MLPFLLLLLAGIIRLWSPGLAPYGPAEERVLAAVREATWTSTPALALVRPLVVDLPWPIETLVVVRGLLDVATVGAIFLAARTLLGVWPSLLAASLYLVSPWAWLAARSAGVTAAPLLAAAALALAVRYQRSPRFGTGLLLGLVVGLLVRADPAGWAFVPALFVAVVLARAPWTSEVSVLFGVLAGGGGVLLSTLGALRPTSAALLDRPTAAFHLAAGTGLRPATDGWLALPAWLDSMSGAALGLVGVLLTLAVIAAAQRVRDGERGSLVALAWTLLPLAALTLIDRPLAAIGPASSTGGSDGLAAGTTTVASLPLPGPGALLSLLPGIVVLLALAVPAAPLATWGRWLVRLLERMPPAAARLASKAPPHIGWGGGVAFAVVSTVTLVSLTNGAVAASESRTNSPFIARDGTAPLRYWQAVADAVQDAAARTGSHDLILLASPDGALTGARARILLAGLLGPDLVIRDLPNNQIVLPLDRETVYLTLPGAERPRLLAWPSAQLAVIPVPGSDPSADVARVVTLRPRPAVDWLVSAMATPEVAFADGSLLAGIQIHPESAGLDLLWQRQPSDATSGATPARPLSADVTATSTEVDVTWQADGQPARQASASLPRSSPRPGELLVQRVAFDPPALDRGNVTLAVRLVSASGQAIPTVDGAPEATVTLSSPH
ncbi:MAG: hypothetical protein IT305_17710 [Chloroflexi bacterium]|nr:hypothetical protein [Chloroflexota bacterium]